MSKRKGMRIPLRLQISGLLVVFIGIVAFVIFRNSFAFLVEDKTTSSRELQTLQVDQISRAFQERVTTMRRSLRDTAAALLDPSRAAVPLDEKVWKWVRVRDKELRAADFTDPLPMPGAAAGATPSFSIQPSADGTLMVFSEPFVIREGAVESTVLIQAAARREAVTNTASSLDRGPIRGVLVDVGALGENPNAATATKAVWMGSALATQGFGPIYSSLDATVRKGFEKPSAPISREFAIGNDQRLLLSWASVPLAGSKQNLTVFSFVTKEELLTGFRKTLAEQGFWAFLIMGFGVFAAGYLARRLSKPIEQLVSASKVLETGDFSVRVDQSRADEIGDLSAAFNHMGQALDEREKALKAAQSALVQNEKLAAIGTLSAGIAHEVKNPLAGILGNAELAIRGIKKAQMSNEAAVLKHIETIHKETKRCQGIIDGLMRFSRGEKTESSSFEETDLEIIAWEAILLMEYSLSKTSVRIEKKFKDDVWTILGAPNQVEQVLLNMYQNAGHAMPDGGVLTLTTEYFPDPAQAPVGRFLAFESEHFKGPFVRLSIGDAGTGMSDEVQRKIFEPFFTTKAKGVGTGLGLAVTMGILGDHKARVSLDSAPGKGTVFHLDFMAYKQRNDQIRTHIEEIRHRKAGGAKLSTDVTNTGTHSATGFSNPGISEAPSDFPAATAESASPESPMSTRPRPTPPKATSVNPPASAHPAGAKFNLRKPVIKGKG